MVNLTEIRQRAQEYLKIAEKATGGSWVYVGRGYTSVNVWRDGGPGHGIICSLSPNNYQDEGEWKECELNAEFIATSRVAGPWLAERVLEALDEIEGLRKIADVASEVLVDVGINEKTISVNREAAEALGRVLIETGYWENDKDYTKSVRL